MHLAWSAVRASAWSAWCKLQPRSGVYTCQLHRWHHQLLNDMPTQPYQNRIQCYMYPTKCTAWLALCKRTTNRSGTHQTGRECYNKEDTHFHGDSQAVWHTALLSQHLQRLNKKSSSLHQDAVVAPATLQRTLFTSSSFRCSTCVCITVCVKLYSRLLPTPGLHSAAPS